MNKIAAYQIALHQDEVEKRASYLRESYGTCEGYLPEPYLQAFDEMEKEAILAGIGKGITGAMRGASKKLLGEGAGAAAEGTFRHSLGTGLKNTSKALYQGGNEAALKGVGGVALGAGALGLGTGLIGGRYIIPKQRQQQ